MQRRTFLVSLAAAAAAGGGAGYLSGRNRRAKFDRVHWKPAALTGSKAPDANAGDYFTPARALEELAATAFEAPKDCQVVAYNFPAWHRSPFMQQAKGANWTEYETLKQARPIFPGHAMPRQPLWGYFDESAPEWAAKEIDAAADHGIDAWMIDWYWHNGVQFYHEQLERGFLAAPNRQRLKFALMWANHDWRDNFPAASPEQADLLLPQAHSEADCLRVIDYCIKHYFRQPNYWRLGGGLVFGIFDLDHLAKQLGRDNLKRVFDAMRERVRKAGLGELHLQSNNVHGHLEAGFRAIGIDSATYYHTFGWSYGGRQPGGLSPYVDGAVNSIRQWKKLRARSSVPVFPDCPVGWDDSPRFGASAHMVVGRSPDQFETLMRAARHFAASQPQKAVYLSSWNEWTEDHVLLPDMDYGYSYLEAVKRAFRT